MLRTIPNFGLWYDFRLPSQWPQDAGLLYRETLDQIVWAETLGFGSVWVSEHHFADDGYSSSPLTICAAIGARTQKMRVGTNIVVAGIHEPIRLAEDATAISLMTEGRFDLGVGLGYREVEFSAFGRLRKQRPSLLEDAIGIIRNSWSGSDSGYTGVRLNAPALSVTPLPERTRAIDRWPVSGRNRACRAVG